MSAAPAAITNAMSIDIEEYFQVGAFEKTIDPADWDGLASRVDHNSRASLDLFAEVGVKATFFMLGWVAERHKALVQDIVAAGHEVASHGYRHGRVHDMTPDAFRADLRKTRGILEDLSGQEIRGYRAPSFSIGRANSWALNVLADEGYAYSSSVAPIAHDHYGWPGSPRFAYRPVEGSPMVEIPVTTVEVGPKVMAAGGGGFFRLLPYAFSRWAIRRVNRHDRQPAVFYFHPWEVDPEQPRVAGAPLKSRIRHYTNLSVMAAKMRQVMQDFRWDRMDRVFLEPA